MTHEELVQYFSTLQTSTTEERRTFRVWYTRPNTEVQEVKSLMLRRGEPVFVDRQGTVVLRLKCGNPMVERTVARTYYNTYVASPPMTQVVTTTTTSRPQRFVIAPIGPLVTQNNLTWEDAAATVILAQATQQTPDQVITLRTTDLASTSFMDLAPAVLMSWSGSRPLADVYSLYTGGTPWVDLATQTTLAPTYWNTSLVPTSSWTNTDFTSNMWQSLLFNNLFVPTSEISWFGTQNIPLEQQLVASVIGREFNLPVRDVLAAYNAANGNWATVENNFLATPPVRVYYRTGG